MYAVVRSGGKQYRVAKDDVIELERLDGAKGQKVMLNEVLLIGENGKKPTLGTPLVKGASVTAEVVAPIRAPKIDVIKFKRRKNYRRQLGHRQELTQVKITDISKTAPKAEAKPAAKAEAKPAAKAEAKPAPKTETKKAAPKAAAKKPAAKKPAAKKTAQKKD